MKKKIQTDIKSRNGLVFGNRPLLLPLGMELLSEVNMSSGITLFRCRKSQKTFPTQALEEFDFIILPTY